MVQDACLTKMGIRVKEEGAGRDNQNDGEVSFVLVPASTSSPLKELAIKATSGATIDPMLDLLEPYFQLQPDETVNISLLEKQADAEREAGCATGMCPHVSPLTLQRAAEEGTLEKIQLSTSACSSNESGDDVAPGGSYTAYMYLDESANLKERPVNPRAVEFAKSKYDGDIFGDVFLARIGANNQIVSMGVQDV